MIYVDGITSRQYTFQDIRDTAAAFGHALKTKWEWKKGDVMGVFSPNCVDTPALTFGTIWAGGMVSPANPAYSVKEVAFQLQNSGAKALITHASCLKTALEASKAAGIPESRILLLGDEKSGDTVHFQQFIASATSAKRLARTVSRPDDLCFLVYSSGTTGLPKGVMLNNRNIVSNTLMTDVGSPEITKDEVLVAVLPLFHIYGILQICNFSRRIV